MFVIQCSACHNMDVLNDKGILCWLLYCLTVFKLITLVSITSTYFCRLLQQQVCRAGYKVIEVFLYGDSRKNELYLSRFIPFFEAQVCKCLCVLCKEIAYVVVEIWADVLYPIEMPTQIYIRRYMTVNSSNSRGSTGYTNILCLFVCGTGPAKCFL